MDSGRPIVKIWNYLRVQKLWNPGCTVNVSDLTEAVGVSRPTVYSSLECLEEMDLVDLDNIGESGSDTLVLVNDSMVRQSRDEEAVLR